jgi:hypothetical protein
VSCRFVKICLERSQTEIGSASFSPSLDSVDYFGEFLKLCTCHRRSIFLRILAANWRNSKLVKVCEIQTEASGDRQRSTVRRVASLSWLVGVVERIGF